MRDQKVNQPHFDDLLTEFVDHRKIHGTYDQLNIVLDVIFGKLIRTFFRLTCSFLLCICFINCSVRSLQYLRIVPISNVIELVHQGFDATLNLIIFTNIFLNLLLSLRACEPSGLLLHLLFDLLLHILIDNFISILLLHHFINLVNCILSGLNDGFWTTLILESLHFGSHDLSLGNVRLSFGVLQQSPV